MRLILPLLLLSGTLFLSACERVGIDPSAILDTRELQLATASQLDSLATDGALISITGTVLEQDDDGLMLLDDGTGLIRVELPEQPPLMTGLRLMATGDLVERDGHPLLEAREWLYDSTAVPVRSDG